MGRLFFTQAMHACALGKRYIFKFNTGYFRHRSKVSLGPGVDKLGFENYFLAGAPARGKNKATFVRYYIVRGSV